MNSQLNDVPGRREEEEVTAWITTPVDPRLLRGALDVERTEHGVLPHRLPARARKQFPDQSLAMVEAQPSGVRLVFRTRATAIELDVLPTKRVYQGAPAPADGVYDLRVDGRPAGRDSVAGGNVQVIDMATGSVVTRPGPPGTVRFTGLSADAKDVEIWLPHTEITELIALRTDAPVEAVPDRGRRVWLHHGSSISHGSNADSPTATWPALAADRGGVELINLGFGGNALLDPFTARALRDTPADLISLKIGINLVNTDLMRLRAFAPAVHGFLDTIREGHPTTPLLVVSPVLCPMQEDTPGPLAPDFDGSTVRFRPLGDPSDRTRLTLNVIRDELSRITALRAADDPNLHYLDGRSLYGEPDFAELPLPDGLHPDSAGHRRIGERFAELAFGDGGPFAAANR
ncbi:GDSL-type esterase/lipase family protein [Streptomyces griseocarneus]|uniref:GDSL-type esterase/lipase family protein n=1 Tax=Streptomyces griseocarneus TaxID=51201 RepID=UPI00167EB7E0|nr:GDSL-type esterase/lipase family protein [Streptomyces griseocarneus]MBZ6477945.1 GDSL-type esterase/lipase family protein [Streptomyces griseocarneus]GHG54414.1 lipase [Streptomyces griseocarneus]